MGAFAVHELVQGYGLTPVIDGLSFQANEGVIGLLGPNGSGKTTLLRTLATVMPPRSGRLTILGVDIQKDADVRMTRRHLGYLPQDFGYYGNFTVYEFVRYCAWLRRIPQREAHRSAIEALEAVNLSAKAKARMKELSGGMLRRAGIAQAIVGDVRLVLLDEPTVGLDPEQRLEFRDLLRRLSTRTTVVLSTHLVEDISAVCTHVGVMSQGDIVFSGTLGELSNAATVDARGDTVLERGYISVLRRHEVFT
ncbi:ATP-binding cassette domain-containing protein [Herbidospora cretacea]|uniref:ATP-binding cassette domain-containing protein n=1 Tax=Herbidospora cretacea TaxID=28444 RepID=UPI0009DCEF43|nr:ATP-binding cassette domain-containing protein [Herbidospora cretacea]